LVQSTSSVLRSLSSTSQSHASFISSEGEVGYPIHVRWTCVRCTNSCRDLPDQKRKILLTSTDIARITNATKLRPSEFSVSSRASAPYERMMKKRNGSCIFLHSSKCSIYRSRPLICRFYPFCIRPSGAKAFEVGFDLKCSGIGTGGRRPEKFFRSLVRLAKTELNHR
jgi:Fe-S-cluster containining protein